MSEPRHSATTQIRAVTPGLTRGPASSVARQRDLGSGAWVTGFLENALFASIGAPL